MRESTSQPNEAIAIIGSACHFAGGANNPSKLWELLRDPRDVRCEIPATRFSKQGFHHPNAAQHGHSNVLHSYLIEDEVTVFDAGFFDVKPVEAKAMDPQQRMLMETVYEAIESAGLKIQSLRNTDTSVFAGVMCADYEALQLRDMDLIPTYLATGTARSLLSNRISYFFDWHGPSLTIDTACSSSLVAVHQAVAALRAGDSSLAVACGSNLILGPENFIMESKLNMLSPDGVGRMWDESANGYARGEGVAALILKPLSLAIADGDHIECLIRETGVNQDGSTPGITMPSAAAQQALIEKTYNKAGLDIRNKEDRPQFFEAHGTGTPAGDPIEAEAISRSFFGAEKEIPNTSDYTLSVGSAKTILGHTEGTAGIAGILRASLAIQYATIPPNLHFRNLNPAILPFYKGVKVESKAKAWPTLAGGPRRASVNSFGFGGTNAHAILESYEMAPKLPVKSTVSQVFTPFVFSARSEKSLRAYLNEFATYLAQYVANLFTPADIHNLLYTLQQRRSLFQHRVTFTAESIQALQRAILESVSNVGSDIGMTIRVGEASTVRCNKILGVFTGQGAQYPRMGATLIEKSKLAERIIRDLEGHLAQLPHEDRPGWSLYGELLADTSTSRVREAAISQPACTAIQILIIDLLRIAGVRFDAVVGHSSGEIAAAYAAGFLTSRDAMAIAYYRGLYSGLAASPNGREIKGAMLAVGTTLDDAQKLCEDDVFAGRVCVAACNSLSSVTISGDEDAISELEVVLSDEGMFKRRLWVDRAYHSPHMKPCINAYLQSLRRADVKVHHPFPGCRWYSSVHGGAPIDAIGPSHTYWVDNMVRPVMFYQALRAAMALQGPFDAILEVGAHPALRSPSLQTMQEIGRHAPYHSCLERGLGAIEAMSNCLGFLWSHAKAGCGIDLNAYETALSCRASSTVQPSLIKGLPSYQWEHDVNYWHESRRSRRMRLRGVSHPLLGAESPDSSSNHRCWRNILKPSEMEWLEGHRVQAQIVFPAAGYITSALEAARSLAEDKEIRLIEVLDFVIHRAITFDSETSAVEALVDLTQITKKSHNTVCAHFTYSASLDSRSETQNLSLVSEGRLQITFGTSSLKVLPARRPRVPHLLELEQSRLYGCMKDLGYNFSGSFRSLEHLQRKHGRASCRIASAPSLHHDHAPKLLFHPAEVDAAFQSIMLAYSYPGDGQLQSLHLPSGISTLRVNPNLSSSSQAGPQGFDIDSICSREDRCSTVPGFRGSFNMYATQCSHAVLQAEGVQFVPFAGAARADRSLFYKIDWVLSEPDGTSAASGIAVKNEDKQFHTALSRVAAYYLRRFDTDVPEDSPARKDDVLGRYLDYARHMTDLVYSGKHRYCKKEWLSDTIEQVMEHVKQANFEGRPDMRLAILIGETMPHVFRRETTMIEHMRTSGLLDEYYSNGFGMRQSSAWLSQSLKQITDRHPHLNILEVGAGTGSATKDILSTIGDSFSTFTFTDISSSFFGDAAENLKTWSDRMIFKVFDLEQSPIEQGFKEAAYDVIVASFVIHATSRLRNTMRHLRKLLRPGGYLVIGEGTSDGPLQAADGYIFGTLPGWWLGATEGRTWTPFINLDQWEALLRETGFSGIQSTPPSKISEIFGLALFVAQADEARLSFLREPLALTGIPEGSDPVIPTLTLIGGMTEATGAIVSELQAMFKDLLGVRDVKHYEALKDVDTASLDESDAIISLVELDFHSFESMTRPSWESFKNLFQTAKTLLWVSTGRLADRPWANMPVGFGRTALNETSGLDLQFLDFASMEIVDSREIARALIRLRAHMISSDNLLWTKETEIIIDQRGNHRVPRLVPIDATNARYNSAHDSVIRECSLETSTLVLEQSWEQCYLRQLSRRDVDHRRTKTTMLRTTHAVFSAIKTQAGHQFLVSGVDQMGSQHLCLVPRLSNFLEISEDCSVAYRLAGHGCDQSSFLTAVAAHLVVTCLLSSVTSGQRVIMHNATSALADAMHYQASRAGVLVAEYRTDSDDVTGPESGSWEVIPPYISRSEILENLPTAQVALFVGFSSAFEVLQQQNEATIISTLPGNCKYETSATIFSMEHTETDSSGRCRLLHDLKEAMRHTFESFNEAGQHVAETVSLGNLVGDQRPKSSMAIVDWTRSTTIPVRLSRLDAPGGMPLFKDNKTYWVCGMSGALGISVCDWMVESGARHIVITSRNPKIENEWAQSHLRGGVSIRIICCDVTDEQALRSVHNDICQTMPPIAGVMNGAMVLRDKSIPNMGYEDVVDVVNPKVLGSIHLDRIFHNTNLDFFILISSITAVVGNVGQANYAAANMHMCALAANRRKRGLNAVALNGGAIIGAGYITRETDRALDLTVEKMALMRLSEDDFHQMIAEAIEAGRVDSPDGLSELTTGLLEIPPDSPNIPKWYRDPKFLRFIVQNTASSEEMTEQTAAASMHDLLQSCDTFDNLALLVRNFLSEQLRKLLMIPRDVVDDVILSKGSSELGLDSLISVDLRSWCLKTFNASIPVLKIMGIDSMEDLVSHIVESVPSDMTPNIAVAFETDEVTDDISITTATSTDFGLMTESVLSSLNSPKEQSPIDWESESTPPVDLAGLSGALIIDIPISTPPKLVVVTGVTGHLGSHLLRHLLTYTESDICCLAVRRVSERLRMKQLPISSRVRYYEGDLAHPLLGLSQETAHSIFARADAVIHNGANTSHVKLYRELRTVNVGSTVALVRLCLPRRIPMHYVSSAGVCIFYSKDTFPPVSVTGLDSLIPALDGSFGYASSKWVNERLLERVHEEYALPVHIYRPSTILRKGADATGPQAELDWVNALLQYTRKVGAAPEVRYNRGALDLVRTETCCASVISRVLEGAAARSEKIEYVNQVGDEVIPMDSIRDMDAKEGKRYDVLPLAEWLRKSMEAGLHPGVARLIQKMNDPAMSSYPRLLKRCENAHEFSP